jgi:DNA (cytosine-5)-methyltransferase 1
VRYGSVCSGIEAATVAWHSLGWKPAFFSEIEAFPRAVLSHHYQDVPLHGDFTTIGDEYGAIDVLVGGTPCQSFSVAGLRKGLDDDRGNLALEYLRLAERLRPTWLVWENVPGVLSSSGGRDFGAFLGGLVELGYGFAYRVLDAQYFGLAQRRRRVFVVGYLGDWRRAAAVLFERESLSGNPAPSRETGESSAADVTHSLRGEGFDASEDGTGRGTPLVPVAPCLDANFAKHHRQDNQHIDGGAGLFVMSSGQANAEVTQDISPTLNCNRDGAPIAFPAVCFSSKDHGGDAMVDCSPTLRAGNSDKSHQNGGQPPAVAYVDSENNAVLPDQPIGPLMAASPSGGGRPLPAVASAMAVRRLTPVECERLQGFPDNYTQIPYRNKPAENCPDGPRYKALGNSMAVPVMRWIGERIAAVDSIKTAEDKLIEIVVGMNG